MRGVFQLFRGRGGDLQEWGHCPFFDLYGWWPGNCHGACGCVIQHAGILQCTYNEAQGPQEVESSAILYLVGSNQFMLRP